MTVALAFSETPSNAPEPLRLIGSEAECSATCEICSEIWFASTTGVTDLFANCPSSTLASSASCADGWSVRYACSAVSLAWSASMKCVRSPMLEPISGRLVPRSA